MNAKEQYMELRASRNGMVLDQIAIYCSNEEEARRAKATWGLASADWTQDIVRGTGTVYGERLDISVAHLQFNYDLGIELEILTYLEGDNWHAHWNRTQLRAGSSRNEVTGTFYGGPFLSHVGFHINDQPMPDLPFPLVQELFTLEHSNPAIAGRSYHYRIYDTREVNGVFSKYIKRVK